MPPLSKKTTVPQLQDVVSKEKLDKYFDITGRALAKVKVQDDPNGFVGMDAASCAADFLDMAKNYYADAQHFAKNNDFINAFAALNYAHGWLDAGARLALFDVGGDNVLFTVDDEFVSQLKNKVAMKK